MSVTTQADEAIKNDYDADRYTELAARLREFDTVADAAVHATRTPPTVEVTLTVASVPTEVADALDTYRAAVVPDSLVVTADGTLAFEARTPEGFRQAGTREARDYGPSSVAFTFTPEAVRISGITDGVNCDIQARDGAILLTRHGEGE